MQEKTGFVQSLNQIHLDPAGTSSESISQTVLAAANKFQAKGLGLHQGLTSINTGSRYVLTAYLTQVAAEHPKRAPALHR